MSKRRFKTPLKKMHNKKAVEMHTNTTECISMHQNFAYDTAFDLVKSPSDARTSVAIWFPVQTRCVFYNDFMHYVVSVKHIGLIVYVSMLLLSMATFKPQFIKLCELCIMQMTCYILSHGMIIMVIE